MDYGKSSARKRQLNNETIVSTVMSNIGLEIALKTKNIKLLRTAVGDKYVLQELIENKFINRRRTIGTYYFSE